MKFSTPSGAVELPKSSVMIVFGTRPEIVKLAPLVRRLGDAAYVVHTGQHYDRAMSGVFLKSCGIERVHRQLHVGGLPRAAQIGRGAEQIAEAITQVEPKYVVVQGDTNATFAAALAANAAGVRLGHVEAGLRARDRRMPEEHNRVMVDHISDDLFAATETNRANLLAEGIDEERILVTGNPVVEAVRAQRAAAHADGDELVRLRLYPARYVLATLHRQENVDSPENLLATLHAFNEIAASGWPVVFPVHPRTRAMLATLDAEHLLDALIAEEPLPYERFLALAAHAAVLVSDSGGIQEEATVLGRPVLVVRDSTERPEALGSFTKLVTPQTLSTEAAALLSSVEQTLARLSTLPSPFGDGHATERIAAHIESVVGALVVEGR
ncbi:MULTISPECIES: non-hydrolyzing UDP-N-acetylglucosamine 2-epimerase [unclassified Microbacterium]|uniref:non-hydrolyzing UDP-N-acetylglucosamine 2-epimerase n=1 Tax=unclassified Microbacterium TaxID=2609290 RepID=UPI000CFD9717|nr:MULTISPECIES: UDP-N-acetylglucosamine 2-epimerase (non-hydrolyzing) [unclassified Microbacterium]PQZ52580.1 UDP-N-acetylglucosamine 2-epimerase (non-hydrolyzing) [Microbacterium sp. MYb43]PQZ80928.1 UDP-N-acetylglucosamine 2-epimerase (non-hydrolyzing) [Microbacterium sp. MYb40]PRB20760.1 UDP-N-acetylglucosamine 2-epimerase (non-hydrolyzing) [Microbacterium sp. MYb54]PRB31821.1 UDP-N-acetylglucosamine 2-epimerase (non-hydrolyzing) [Microbacterium sp. MYb50]PRB61855.1 UDP-N-acetylglucosamine